MSDVRPTTPPPPPHGLPWSAEDRIRHAWQTRAESDYVFDFWSQFGWTILSCGVYGFYVLYQQIRRSRDHNLRRIEFLDATTTYAWERTWAAGRGEEQRQRFERIAVEMATLRRLDTQFRDPVAWMVIAIVASGIANIVAYVLLDKDLVTHDRAECIIENELCAIFAALGASVRPPDFGRVKVEHNLGGRIVATLASCGIYAYWWQYDSMTDLNRHFVANWQFEDDIAAAVQQLAA